MVRFLVQFLAILNTTLLVLILNLSSWAYRVLKVEIQSDNITHFCMKLEKNYHEPILNVSLPTIYLKLSSKANIYSFV